MAAENVKQKQTNKTNTLKAFKKIVYYFGPYMILNKSVLVNAMEP
jgi:hypothetical protein